MGILAAAAQRALSILPGRRGGCHAEVSGLGCPDEELSAHGLLQGNGCPARDQAAVGLTEF